MTTPDEIVALELARLSANFVSQLPEQLQEVESEFAAWLDAPQDTARFEILSHRVHQLKGSGSTFGCPGVSRAARTLEKSLGAYQQEIDAGRPPAPEAVESALTSLQNEARRARAQSPDPDANS
jgi:chemotaxis protein histidine kinase CheA